jgi:hypothetical protein
MLSQTRPPEGGRYKVNFRRVTITAGGLKTAATKAHFFPTHYFDAPTREPRINNK